MFRPNLNEVDKTLIVKYVYFVRIKINFVYFHISEQDYDRHQMSQVSGLISNFLGKTCILTISRQRHHPYS